MISKDFCFSNRKYANVGLPTRKEGNFSFGLSSFGAGKMFGDNSPKAFMFIGNLKGIFGEVLNGELRPDLSNEQTFGKNFSEWLIKEVSLGSVFYVVGTNNLINEYFAPVFNKVDEWLCKRCKFRAYSIERFAKLKKLPLKSEKDYGLMYVEIIKWLMEEKKMKFDYILMNPPYNVGNKITSAAISSCDKCVCLMPLSQYKSNELYRHVDKMELADPEMFVDADITNNLCICTLLKSVVDRFKTYEEMSMESYDPRFKVFYEVNSKLPLRYVFKRCDNSKIEDFDLNVDIIEGGRLMDSDTGISGPGGMGYKINVLKQYNTKLNSCLTKITCSNSTVKANLIKFLYGTDKCWNKVMFGMNLKTTAWQASIAIPQIDWETISDTPLWKEGKYDEAVLDVMGLKWDDEKDGVVRK